MLLRLLCVLILSRGQALPAQQAVSAAIASGLLEAAKFDPQIDLAARIFVDTESFRAAGGGTGDQWATVAQGAGRRGAVQAAETVKICTRSPFRCTMPDDAVLVTAKSVALGGATGTVGLRIEWLGAQRGKPAIEHAELLVTLKRTGDQWSVVHVKLGSVS